MKNFMTILILAGIALIIYLVTLIKELKIYLRKSSKFENNLNVKEGIIKKIEKTKKKYTFPVIYKYTVYVELSDNKIIKTIIKPKKLPFGRVNRYINREKT